MRWGFVVRVAALKPVSGSLFRSVERIVDAGLKVSGAVCLAIGLLATPSVGAQGPARLKLVIPDVVLADPGETIDLAIDVAPVEAIPDNALVRIKGVPPRISLNAGYLVSPGTWAVPISAIGALKATVPDDLTVRAEITFLLADVDGRIHAEKQSRLIVARTGGGPSLQMAQVATIAIPSLAVPLVPVKPATGLIKAREVTSKVQAEAVHALPALPSSSQLQIPADVRLELEQILAEGDQALISGDVDFARRIYRLVTERGLGLAAIKMAETFDPAERARLKIKGADESEAIAKAWYRRAADLGEKRALDRLKRLETR